MNRERGSYFLGGLRFAGSELLCFLGFLAATRRASTIRSVRSRRASVFMESRSETLSHGF
jgi:hypothetical protein